MSSPWWGSWSSGRARPCHTFGRSASALDGDAHRASGTRDDLGGLLDVVRVQVLELRLRDLTDLGGAEPADLRLLRLAGALGDAGGLLDDLGGRRGCCGQGEGPVPGCRGLPREY